MAQLVFPSPPKSLGGSQRRSRSSTTVRSVQVQQEEPLRVKNFVGAALPSPEYLRWFHSKVKYDELLRFYAHLTERVALSEKAVVSWQEVCQYMSETFIYFQKDHPMRILFKESGDNLRQLYEELSWSLRTDADSLLVHRDFTTASFAKRLAVACYVKARRWGELEDTEGQRLELQKFRDQFRDAEIRGRSSVDLDKVVEECNPFLVNYFRQGIHFRYPDVAKAYTCYLRLAYQKFGFDFPVGDDLTVLTTAVPSPPVAPESPMDEYEVQYESTTSDFPTQDVEMSAKEEDKTIFPDAELGSMKMTPPPPPPLEAMEVDEKDSQILESVDSQEDVSDVTSLLDTSANLQPTSSAMADASVMDIDQDLQSSATIPSSNQLTDALSNEIAIQEILPLDQPSQISHVAESSQPTPEDYFASKLSSSEMTVAETAETETELVAEPTAEEIPSPALLPTSPVRSIWSSAVKTPLLPSAKTKNQGKKKSFPAAKNQTKQFSAAGILPKALEQTGLQSVDRLNEAAEIPPDPTEFVSTEKSESISLEKPGKEKNEEEHVNVVVLPRLDQFFLEFLGRRQRKFTNDSMSLAVRGLLGSLFKEIPTDLVDYDPFKLPIIQPKYKDSIEKPQSFLQLVKRLKEASCDVEEVVRALPLVALNAVAYNSGSSEVTKLGLQLQLDCSTILRKVTEIEENPDVSALTSKIDILRQAVTDAKINRKTRDRTSPSLFVEEVVLLGDYKPPLVKIPSSRTRQSVQQIIVSPPANLATRTRAAKFVSAPSTASKSARKKI